MSSSPSHAPHAAAVLAAAFGGAAFLHLTNGNATISLPNGILLAMLLCAPPRRWAALLASLICGSLAAALAFGAPAATSLVTALAAALETACAAILLRRWIGAAPDLAATANFLRFVATAGLAAAVVGGVLTEASLHLLANTPLAAGAIATRIVADGIGMVVGAPFVVHLLRGDVAASFPRGRRLRPALLLVGATTATLVTLLQTRYPLLFLISPWVLVIGGAIDFVGVTMFVPILAAAAFGCTAFGLGPFSINEHLGPIERRLLVQAFVCASVLVGRFAATIERGRATAEAALKADRNWLFESRQEIAASAEQFRLLLSGVVDHAVYLLDPSGRVASWNAGAEHIKGYRPAEIIGQSFAVFFTLEDQVTGEPDRVLTVAREQGHFERECWRVRKDGSRFWARVVLRAVRDQQGKLVGFAKVAQDLTSRMLAEAQREIIIEAAPNGMIIVGESGAITLSNSQADKIFGYPSGALMGQSVEILVPAPLRHRHSRLRAAFGRGDGEAMLPTRQFSACRRDGSTVAVDIALRRANTPHGGIIVVSIVDATERLRLQAEREAAEARERARVAETNAKLEELAGSLREALARARHANDAKSRFLAGMSHELRTPLNGILGYAQLLCLEGGLSPVQAGHVQAMLGAGQHLLGMINAVLDLSLIESEQMELRPAGMDLPDMANACLDVVRPAATAKGLALGLRVAPAAPRHAVADHTRLRQVLVNLLGNAVKFTPDGGVELRLLAGLAACHVRFEVADTGPGITAAQRRKLFHEFERLGAEDAAGIEGSGLGLAIAAGLMRRMGGTIGHADNSDGGSVFWIELPENAGAAEAGPPDAPSARPAPRLQRHLRILVVDDLAMNRDIAGRFLALAGHEIAFAESGQAAIAAAEAADFDVILMDVRMPGMDGLEATRRIRALPAPRGQTPVVAVTAQAFTDQIEKCREAGMNLHVSKPIEAPSLLAAVDRAAACAPPAPPVLDEAAYHAMREILAPEKLEEYLATLIAHGETLLSRLHAPGLLAEAREIAEAAHMVGGSASNFGFRRLASAASGFERAAELNAPEIAERAAELAETTRASVATLRRLTAKEKEEVLF